MKELPRVFDSTGIAADQVGDEMLLQVRGDRELASVQRGIAEPVDAGARLDLQRDDVLGTRHDDAGRDDFTIFHFASLTRGSVAGSSRGTSHCTTASATDTPSPP